MTSLNSGRTKGETWPVMSDDWLLFQTLRNNKKSSMFPNLQAEKKL